jgi:hypothetical protein
MFHLAGGAGGGLVEGPSGLPPVGSALPTCGWHCRTEQQGSAGDSCRAKSIQLLGDQQMPGHPAQPAQPVWHI